MITFITLVIEALLLVSVARRIRPLTAPVIVMCYIVLSQAAFTCADWFGYSPGYAGAILSYSWNRDTGVIVYFFLFAIAYASTLGIRIAGARDFARAATQIDIAARLLDRHAGPILGVLWVSAVVQIAALDPSALWWNGRYLLLKSDASLVFHAPITRIVFGTAQLAGMASVLLATFGLLRRKWILVLLATPPAFWALLLALASSSRSAVVLVAIPGVVAWMVGGRGRIALLTSSILASALVLVAVIMGRQNGEFGISSIPKILSLPFGSPEQTSRFFLNVAQGIFSTTDAISIPATHNEIYKVLSFSPLPASLDGFDTALRLYEIRLHPFVPMSAIAEAYHFGWIYTALLGMVFFCAFRASVRAYTNFWAYLITTPLVVFLFIQAGAYPVRNIFRQMLIVLLFLAVARLALNRGWFAAWGHPASLRASIR
jgi:hypothetical protein